MAVCWLTLKLLLRHKAMLLLDHPNERSLHVKPTPRFGSFGIMAGLLICVLFLSSQIVLMLILAAMGLFVLSILDDFGGLSVRIRIVAHVLMAGVTLYLLPDLPGWAWWFALPALVWMTNLYNFMDGSDGLAGGMALFGFTCYGIAAWFGGADSFALLAWAIAAATAGFLCFNFPPARAFMGDAGSIPLGYLAGALGLAGWVLALWPIAFPLLVFSPFIVDASLTLARRVIAGERVWLAHRNHYYQRLVRMGWSQRRLLWSEYCLMAACGVSALVLVLYPDWQLAICMTWLACYIGLVVSIDRCWRKSGFAI